MGCCCSGHEEAKLTELPPPVFGKDARVKMKKQGYFDADFDILDMENPSEDGNPRQCRQQQRLLGVAVEMGYEASVAGTSPNVDRSDTAGNSGVVDASRHSRRHDSSRFSRIQTGF